MDTTMKATRVAKVPRRSKTYGEQRYCADDACSTRLSMYNKHDKCNQHKGVHQDLMISCIGIKKIVTCQTIANGSESTS